MPHTTAFAWDCHTLGNHRAVVSVPATGTAARVRIPWRRRDRDPERKHLVVVDAQTGRAVANVARISIEREAGEIAFEPTSGAGEYHVYYLPYEGDAKAHYPQLSYPEPRETADPAWSFAEAIQGEFLRFEAVAPHHEFGDMERVATRDEVAGIVASHQGEPFIVFIEDRDHPIRMDGDVPQRWVESGADGGMHGSARRGEFYAFQVGVYAHLAGLDDVQVEFGDLDGPETVPAIAFRCLTTGGVSHDGGAFRRAVSIRAGSVQAFWCGVQLPDDVRPGRYETAIWVTCGDDTVSIPLALDIAPDLAPKHGDDDPGCLSRLRWLDSTLAADDTVVPPFTPVERDGAELRVLGRVVTLGDDGLPASIRSRFTPEVTSCAAAPAEMLAGPIRLRTVPAEGAGDEGEPFAFLEEQEGAVTWTCSSRRGNLGLQLTGKLEFDGTLEMRGALRAHEDLALDDVALEVPLRREFASHMMGMGFKGGKRPAEFDWKWDVAHNQDSLWIGAPHGGLQVTLKDDAYRRPLNTNFYHRMPLRLPRSWHNEGKGGVAVRERGDAVLLRCSSGPRAMAKGEVLRFDFRLAVTPFKPLDTRSHFATRYCHEFLPVEQAKATGGNTVNVHHATAINPYINYPFLRAEAMKAFVDEAHEAGMRVKIYYTVRELTTRAPELWALRSLGHEVFSAGAGGGYSWLQEHVGEDYIPAWFDPAWEDCSLVTSGMNRWHNYYVEGLEWLADRVGIDGIYLDDVAFDREIMKRMRRVLARLRPDPLIDLHSANQYNPNDGFASSANLYLEHFPFVDRLWFGEYFDYDSAPDYWLVEMSGIPFGVMGEMLQGGGNPWRGMVFGMTRRWYGDASPDPRPTWRLLDAFGMEGAEMLGWWSPGVPVRTGRDDVLATVYRRKGKSLVALASWCAEEASVRLEIDWEALGLDPRSARVRARESEGFQPAADFGPKDAIPVEPGKGWLLEVSEG